MHDYAKVGDPPNIVKGELIKRGYSYRLIASELEVHPGTIYMLINGRTSSRRISDYINGILSKPVHTN